MKWLIISAPDQSSVGNEIASFLTSHKAEFVQFKKLGVQGDSLQELWGILPEITQVVLLLDESPEFQCVIQYIAGYADGREIPLFAVAKTGTVAEARAEADWCLHRAVMCADSAELKKKLENSFDYFLSADEKKGAHKKLYAQGIPLTEDCLATYVAKGDLDRVSLFIAAGMSADARNSDGTPMLCIAARSEQVKMIKLLIAKGADIDAVSGDRGYSAVMDAVWKSSYDIAKILVDAGANLNFVSRDGQTALVLAVGSGNESVCELLSTHGADVNMKDRMGMSALDYAKLFKKDNLISLFTAAKG
ncbi:MAG: ankyrin repeat domain-containing protein [Spirochaetaceae bacterium]|jgi:hypothetical protein|nr:ankyrin repeat domain-containing protein [Spirochaetaceae bacterium]